MNCHSHTLSAPRQRVDDISAQPEIYQLCKNDSMATLSQLLAMPHLGLTLVQSGAEDPEITWGSITELLHLSDYLEGGEIIMTTGLQLGPEASDWNDFVAGLSRARIAAIGFGVGVNHERIPAPLIRAASTYRVALFSIPLPVPFIAVSKAIAELLRADELRAAHTALQVQRRILDRAGGDQDPADVLASIAQATGRQLALIAAGNPDQPVASTAGFAGELHDPTNRVPLDPDNSMYLAISGAAPLTPEGSSVIAAGAMVLGLGLRGDRAAERVERERWAELALRVLGEELPFKTVRVLAPHTEIPDAIRALAVQGSPEDLAAWRREEQRGADRLITPNQNVEGGLARAWQLIAAGEADGAASRVARHGLDAVIGRVASPESPQLSVRSAKARLQDLPGIASLYVEPRSPHLIWADRDAPFLEALLTLDEREQGSNYRSDARTGLRAELRDELRTLGLTVLGPLSRSAPGHEPPVRDEDERVSAADRELLRETLRTLFTADGQRGPAAAALGIHRNTLRDRIARIERLTNRSLASAEDRAELWFAIRTEDLSPAQKLT